MRVCAIVDGQGRLIDVFTTSEIAREFLLAKGAKEGVNEYLNNEPVFELDLDGRGKTNYYLKEKEVIGHKENSSKIIVFGLPTIGIRKKTEKLLEYRGEIPRFEERIVSGGKNYRILSVDRVIKDGREDHVEVFV